jgi:hypothetical protein
MLKPRCGLHFDVMVLHSGESLLAVRSAVVLPRYDGLFEAPSLII